MTDDMMTLRSLLEKNSDADLLREMIGFTAQGKGEKGTLPFYAKRPLCPKGAKVTRPLIYIPLSP